MNNDLYLPPTKEPNPWEMFIMLLILVFFVWVVIRTTTIGDKKTTHTIYIPIGTYTISAYQARSSECDSTPDVGAGGVVARNGKPTGRWFANNTLPFGTKITIPSVSGSTVWTCRDRMNSRYNGRCIIDLLVSKGAVVFGKRSAKVFIITKGVSR